MHSILERQLAKLQCVSEGPVDIQLLQELVSQTYEAFEKQYLCIKNSFDITNAEYIALKNKIEDEALLSVQQSEKKFRALYEASSDAVMILNQQGFTACNNATLKMFMLASEAQFINLHPAQLSPLNQPGGESSLEAAKYHINQAYANGSNRFDWVHKRSNGEEFYAEVLLSNFNLDGNVVLQAVVRDITKRKQLEESLTQAKETAEHESKLKSHFLSNMSHELRTPVHGIFGFSDLLKNSALNAEQQIMIKNLTLSSEYLLDIIDNILQLASLDAENIQLTLQPTVISDIIYTLQQEYNLLSIEKNLNFKVDVPISLDEFDCDHDKLVQILNNLIGNAFKFTLSGSILIKRPLQARSATF